VPRPGHDIIVVGASAGGIETLKRLVRDLPQNIPATIFVVVHVPSHYDSHLPDILQTAGRLPATHAMDYALIQRGWIYVAPPDSHLLLEPDRMRVLHGPKENRHRPAIDPLFRSAAWALGPRVVGVILSGTLDDGAAGLWAVKSTGGTTIVQDPAEAKFSGMPTSALLYSKVDHVLPINEIAPLLLRLANEPAPGEGSIPKTVAEEAVMTSNPPTDMKGMDEVGDLSAFTCPACGGALWHMEEGGTLHFRCHVGHAYNGESLLADQSELVEKSVYMALRALREQAEIERRVGTQLANRGSEGTKPTEDRARELDGAALVLEDLLHKGRV